MDILPLRTIHYMFLPPKDNNKTWYSQTKANGSESEYNNYNLSSSFTSRMAKDGCALTSIAMVLHNMNAKTKDKIYDSRTGYTGYMYADPYIVFMAKKGLQQHLLLSPVQ